MLIGTVGPWMEVLGRGTPGADGIGMAVIGGAVIAALFLWQHTREGGTALGMAGMTLGVVSAAICGWELYDILSKPAAELPGERVEVVTAGWGIYVSLFGSLMLAGASYSMSRDDVY